MSTIAIEVDTPKDTNLFFPPIGKRIRGRFDAQRRVARNPDNASLLGQWPKPVPGQRLVLDTDKETLTIQEPLEDDENKDIVELFRKRGIKIPTTETYQSVHVPSCLHCLKHAVDAGLATITEGAIPKTIKGEMLKSFITPDSEDVEETLRKTVAENTVIMRECVEAIKTLAESIAKGFE